MQIHLVSGVDYTDLTHMSGLANLWADKLRLVLPTSFVINGWGTKAPDGSVYYNTSFSTPLGGGHGDAGGVEDYVSRTITITGKGTPITPGDCAGPARNVVFVGKSFNFTPRQKTMPAGVDSGWDDYVDWLLTHPDIWADHWGQKAGARPLYPVQFNAATQRRSGT